MIPRDVFSNTYSKLFLVKLSSLSLVKDECSSLCSGVGDFLMSVWDQRTILYGGGSACVVDWTNPTPECKANGIECYGC